MAKKQSALQKAYSKFFKQKLRKYGVSSPAQIKNSTTKKQFFNEVAEDWQARRRRIRDPEKFKNQYYAYYTNKPLIFMPL